MSQKPDASSDKFNELLGWLNPDRELAGRLYEEIRRDLIKIFGWNRCIDPEGMADETLDRVANKAKRLRETFEGNPKLFFYGVANNLIKEYQKTIRLRVPIQDIDPPANPPAEIDDEETSEIRTECLQRCLEKLSSDKRELLKAYYAREKRVKIDQRSEMAHRLGISVETLRVRMYRIRVDLEECIESCLGKHKASDETD